MVYNKRVEELVEQLDKTGVFTDPRIREAFLAIDRKDFVPEALKASAYIDTALSIGEGQTISQPWVVALMLGLLQAKQGDKIMDVGSGSGWQTGLLAHIVGPKGKIYAIEIIPELCGQARANLAKYDFQNIELLCQDARAGLPQAAPFDGIIAGASGEAIPEAWLEQIKVGGNIVAPVEDSVVVYIKRKDGSFDVREYPGFRFVPLV